MVMRSTATDGRSASKCQRKWPDQPLGRCSSCPEVTVAVRTSRLSCRKAGKTRVFTPVWESSGESRLTISCCKLCPLQDTSQINLTMQGGHASRNTRKNCDRPRVPHGRNDTDGCFSRFRFCKLLRPGNGLPKKGRGQISGPNPRLPMRCSSPARNDRFGWPTVVSNDCGSGKQSQGGEKFRNKSNYVRLVSRD